MIHTYSERVSLGYVAAMLLPNTSVRCGLSEEGVEGRMVEMEDEEEVFLGGREISPKPAVRGSSSPLQQEQGNGMGGGRVRMVRH